MEELHKYVGSGMFYSFGVILNGVAGGGCTQEMERGAHYYLILKGDKNEPDNYGLRGIMLLSDVSVL